MAILYGVPPSPYVRKAMLVLAYKEVPFEFKVTFPGSDDPEFRDASPLGKVPAFRTDDGIGFSDSSVITAYLERVDNKHPLYPADNSQFAKALWLEEYADTKMMEATAALYFQRILGPKFFNQQTDPERVKQLESDLIPAVLEYMETQVSDGWLVNNQFSIADITVGVNLMNLMHADYQIDAEKWPKLAAYSKRFLTEEKVKQQIAAELQVINQ